MTQIYRHLFARIHAIAIRRLEKTDSFIMRILHIWNRFMYTLGVNSINWCILKWSGWSSFVQSDSSSSRHQLESKETIGKRQSCFSFLFWFVVVAMKIMRRLIWARAGRNYQWIQIYVCNIRQRKGQSQNRYREVKKIKIIN